MGSREARYLFSCMVYWGLPDPTGIASLKLGGCLALALLMGFGINLGLGFGLGPSWGSSLGLVTALYALFWGVIARQD